MTPSARVVLVLFVISFLAGVVSGHLLYFRLAYLWGGLLLLSYGMSRLALRGIHLRRTARNLRSQVGQIFEERFEVVNASRLPHLWLEVQDKSPLPASYGSHVLTLIGGRESRTYLARTRLVERGVYPLGPTTIASGDIFGLFPVEKVFPPQDSLLVYPLIVEVASFPSPSGLLPGGEALQRRTPHITPNAAGVREYVSGDPLSRIHWVSTARRERLMVKEFELDPLAEVWLFLDASRASQAAKPYRPPEFDPRDLWRRRMRFDLPPSTLEYAVTAAASLARYYLRRGRAVGLAYVDQALRVLSADRGGRQLGKVLEALAVVKPLGNMSLYSLVEAQARHLPRGSTVVLITAVGSDAVVHTVDLTLRRRLRPVVVLLDGASFGGYVSAQRARAALSAMNIPHCVIQEGDNLSQALAAAVNNRNVAAY